jgi:hypothetical protein
MASLAQYSVTVASLGQQVEAWLLSQLFNVLFLMILTKALLQLPLFYLGPLLVVVTLTLRKRLATPLRTACHKTTFKVQHKGKKKPDRWIRFVRPILSFIIFVWAAGVIFEIVRASPYVATDAHNTVQEFTDPRHGEGDPLSAEQWAIVERYSVTYSKTQLRSLNLDERFVASQIAKHKRDKRWLYVQSVLQRFAHGDAPSQNQISQHFFALWRQLEEDVKARAAEKLSPTPE